MLLDKRDVDFLRLLCWCQFLRPSDARKIIPKEELRYLCERGLATFHEKSGAYVPTRGCRNLVAGLTVPPTPIQTRNYHEEAIVRRLRTSSIFMTAYRAGVNVFTTTAEELAGSSALFLTAFARNHKSNPWGSSRVVAMAHLGDLLCATFYVCSGIGKITLTDELTAISNQAGHFKGVRQAMIFAGESYSDILTELEAQRTEKDSKLVFFGQAYRQVQQPIHLITCDDAGAMQLKIMATPDYRTQLTKAILGTAYSGPPEEVAQWDGFYRGLPFIVAADMDLRRINSALEAAHAQGYEKIAMACLKGQQKRLLSARYDKTGKADVYQITPEALSAVLGAEAELYAPAPTQFLTEKGDVVHAPLIKTH